LNRAFSLKKLIIWTFGFRGPRQPKVKNECKKNEKTLAPGTRSCDNKTMQTQVSFTPKQALEFIGGLSSPSKMPCFSFSIPAWYCVTGQKLRNVKSTICSRCYALKGRYVFGPVKAAMERRFAKLQDERWVEAMVVAIRKKEKSGFFRWHDSGDVQSVEHLEKIVAVAKALPDIRFWLPTREYFIVANYFKKHGSIPENLTIRLSALSIDGPPPSAIAKRFGLVTSGVTKQGFDCPSSLQDGKCRDCRACWNKTVETVNYKLH